MQPHNTSSLSQDLVAVASIETAPPPPTPPRNPEHHHVRFASDAHPHHHHHHRPSIDDDYEANVHNSHTHHHEDHHLENEQDALNRQHQINRNSDYQQQHRVDAIGRRLGSPATEGSGGGGDDDDEDPELLPPRREYSERNSDAFNRLLDQRSPFLLRLVNSALGNFFAFRTIYQTVTVLLSAIFIYVGESGRADRGEFFDCLFSAVSATATTGLATVNVYDYTLTSVISLHAAMTVSNELFFGSLLSLLRAYIAEDEEEWRVLRIAGVAGYALLALIQLLGWAFLAIDNGAALGFRAANGAIANSFFSARIEHTPLSLFVVWVLACVGYTLCPLILRAFLRLLGILCRYDCVKSRVSDEFIDSLQNVIEAKSTHAHFHLYDPVGTKFVFAYWLVMTLMLMTPLLADGYSFINSLVQTSGFRFSGITCVDVEGLSVWYIVFATVVLYAPPLWQPRNTQRLKTDDDFLLTEDHFPFWLFGGGGGGGSVDDNRSAVGGGGGDDGSHQNHSQKHHRHHHHGGHGRNSPLDEETAKQIFMGWSTSSRRNPNPAFDAAMAKLIASSGPSGGVVAPSAVPAGGGAAANENSNDGNANAANEDGGPTTAPGGAVATGLSSHSSHHPPQAQQSSSSSPRQHSAPRFGAAAGGGAGGFLPPRGGSYQSLTDGHHPHHPHHPHPHHHYHSPESPGNASFGADSFTRQAIAAANASGGGHFPFARSGKTTRANTTRTSLRRSLRSSMRKSVIVEDDHWFGRSYHATDAMQVFGDDATRGYSVTTLVSSTLRLVFVVEDKFWLFLAIVLILAVEERWSVGYTVKPHEAAFEVLSAYSTAGLSILPVNNSFIPSGKSLTGHLTRFSQFLVMVAMFCGSARGLVFVRIPTYTVDDEKEVVEGGAAAGVAGSAVGSGVQQQRSPHVQLDDHEEEQQTLERQKQR